MKKLFLCLAVCLMSAVMVQAVNIPVDTAITVAAVGVTNDIPNVKVGSEWCELERIQIAFPPVSTSTVSFYSVADNGQVWQIGTSMTYANTAATSSTQSYNPMKSVEYVNVNGSTNSTQVTYSVKGNIRYVITKTGATSQTFGVLFLLKK